MVGVDHDSNLKLKLGSYFIFEIRVTRPQSPPHLDFSGSLDRIGWNLDTISIKDTEVGKVNFWAFIGMLGYGSVRLVLGGVRLG